MYKIQKIIKSGGQVNTSLKQHNNTILLVDTEWIQYSRKKMYYTKYLSSSGFT